MINGAECFNASGQIPCSQFFSAANLPFWITFYLVFLIIGVILLFRPARKLYINYYKRQPIKISSFIGSETVDTLMLIIGIGFIVIPLVLIVWLYVSFA